MSLSHTTWTLAALATITGEVATAQWQTLPSQQLDRSVDAIAVSGDTVITGDTTANQGGAVRIYERTPGQTQSWVEIRKIQYTPPAAGYFGAGFAVAIEGDTALVANVWEYPDEGSIPHGEVLVLERDEGGASNWGEVEQLPPGLIVGEWFGSSVAISGDTALIGSANYYYWGGVGRGYVYERNVGGNPGWIRRAELVSPNGSGEFGTRTSISGDVAVFGGSNVSVFERDLGGPDTWGLAAYIQGPPSFGGFGYLSPAVVDGDTLLIAEIQFSGPDRVHWYTRELVGGVPVWSQTGEIPAPAPADGQFGTSLYLEGDRAFIGAPYVDHGGFGEAGALFAFERKGTGWLLEEAIHSPMPGPEALFGQLLAMEGNTLVCAEPVAQAAPTKITALAFNASTGEAYGSDDPEDRIVTMDPVGGAMDFTAGLTTSQIEGLAYDPTSDTLYGSDTYFDELVRINPNSCCPTTIGPLGFGAVRGLAFDTSTGTLYGVDAATDQLVRVDTATGAATAIGALGFGGPNGLAYHAGNDLLYATDTATDQLFVVDRATGTGTAVGPLGHDNVIGLAPGPGNGLIGADNHSGAVLREVLSIDPGTGNSAVIKAYQSGSVVKYTPRVHFFEECIPPVTYCAAGVSASGCSAVLTPAGTPSATASSGFTLTASTAEGDNNGLFFFGSNGRQANPWGNGTSLQCVKPPVRRAGVLTGTGTGGQCNGSFSQDLNAYWCPTCPKPQKNPGAGTLVQAQLWYRDPFSTSNQTTSLSNAVEFCVGP